MKIYITQEDKINILLIIRIQVIKLIQIDKSILQDIDSILNKKNLDLLYKHMKIILIETINLM